VQPTLPNSTSLLRRPKVLRCRWNPPPRGSAETAGDPSPLFEAISNLVENAIKYSPSGSSVRMRVVATGDRVGIEVSDTGSGIPEEERDTVLRRFHRVDRSRTVPGSGLGLSLGRPWRSCTNSISPSKTPAPVVASFSGRMDRPRVAPVSRRRPPTWTRGSNRGGPNPKSGMRGTQRALIETPIHRVQQLVPILLVASAQVTEFDQPVNNASGRSRVTLREPRAGCILTSICAWAPGSTFLDTAAR